MKGKPRRNMCIRLDEELYEKIREIASKSCCSVSQQAYWLLRRAVDNRLHELPEDEP